LAGHVIDQLLSAGYRVRGTTRNPGDEKKLAHLTGMLNASERLELVKAELDDVPACVAACHGADYVIHCASPYSLKVADPQKDLVDPAVSGAVNFLHAAHASKTVKRVVMTSSMAAVTEHPVTGHVFTEADWNTKSSLTRSPYYYSKTVAEKAAWDFASANGVDLVTICPYIILGTSLNAAGAENPSLDIIQRVTSGAFPGIFNFHFGIVDVADVASAHVLAMTSPNAKGRYVCVGGSVPMKRLVHVLQHHFPQYPINTNEMDGAVGTAALKLGSYFESRDVGQYMRSNGETVLHVSICLTCFSSYSWPNFRV
jgi:dihydroflavonol-4-reductase